jgi:hypothetical protein
VIKNEWRFISTPHTLTWSAQGKISLKNLFSGGSLVLNIEKICEMLALVAL